ARRKPLRLRLTSGWASSPPLLIGYRKHRRPELAIGAQSLRLTGGHCERDVDCAVLPEADEDVGFACQRRMGSLACELLAEQAVGRVGLHATDVVARVDVFDVDRVSLLRKVLDDPLLEQGPNVLQLSISRFVVFDGSVIEQV